MTMSLIATILSGQKPTLIGTETTYLVDEYRPVPQARKHAPAPAVKATPWDHLRAIQDKHQQQIVQAISAGHITQSAITKKTGMAKSTVSINLKPLIASGKVRADKTVWPYRYALGAL